MKQIILIVVALFGVIVTGFSQTKVVDKAVIKTPGVHCDMSKTRIENYLKRHDGLRSVTVDVKRKTTTVTWLTSRTNIQNIKTDIANAGFDADDVTAEPDAYNMLPKCCKKPEAVEKKN